MMEGMRKIRAGINKKTKMFSVDEACHGLIKQSRADVAGTHWYLTYSTGCI